MCSQRYNDWNGVTGNALERAVVINVQRNRISANIKRLDLLEIIKFRAKRNEFIIVKQVQQDATIAFLFPAMALLYMFRATISPIIRSTYAVYGHR